MRILCDIDNVLNDLTEKAIKLFEKETGKHYELSQLIKYNFGDCMPAEDERYLLNLFKKKELWDSLAPLPGSIEGVRTLIKHGHDVYFPTATHPENFVWKCAWLKEKFPFIDPDNIIRIKDKSLLTADIIIDDCMEQLTHTTAERICLSYPWNQNKNKDFVYDIFRANTWEDIIKIIINIENREAKLVNEN